MTEIGRIVHLQTEIEEVINQTISDLICLDDPVGIALTSELSFKNKLAVSMALIRHAIGSSHPTFNKLIELTESLRKFEEFRNKTAHSLWLEDNDSKHIIRRKTKTTARNGVHYQEDAISISDMRTIINNANAAIKQWQELSYEISKPSTDVINPGASLLMAAIEDEHTESNRPD